MNRDDNVMSLFFSILSCIGSVASFLCCWFFIRPADKKLESIKSELQRNNESLSSMRNALLDSSVRLTEAKYKRLVESCEDVYRSFMKMYCTSAGLLMICASLKDLDEIRKYLQTENKLDRAREWLNLFVKDEMLVPIKSDDLSTAEIYVPDKVWKLYNAGNSLYASAIMQMATLKNGIDIQLVKLDKVYSEIETVLPGQKEFLEKFGTFGYQSSMNVIKISLLNEIRLAIQNECLEALDVIDINRRFERDVNIPPVPTDLVGMVAK